MLSDQPGISYNIQQTWLPVCNFQVVNLLKVTDLYCCKLVIIKQFSVRKFYSWWLKIANLFAVLGGYWLAQILLEGVGWLTGSLKCLRTSLGAVSLFPMDILPPPECCYTLVTSKRVVVVGNVSNVDFGKVCQNLTAF